MENTNQSMKIEKLAQDNWATWEFEVKHLLGSKLLDERIGDNPIPIPIIEPGDEPTNAQEILIKKEKQAKSMIVLSISKDYFYLVKDCATAKDCFNALKEYHTQTGLMGKNYYKEKMFLLKEKALTKSIHELVSELNILKSKYISAGGTMEDSDVIETLKMIVTEDYRKVIASVENLPDL
jgi:hypothetical protein